MERFGGDSNNLYGGSIITSFDRGHLPEVKNKNINIENKIKDDDNILMNSSIKKVMQKNRELHKMVTKLQSENDKLTKENAKYKSIIEKYKSR